MLFRSVSQSRYVTDPEIQFSYPMKPKELLSILGKINHNVPNRIPYVCNRDLDLFLKRLRSYYPDEKIRYYALSEYGPTSFRPHWHLLLFSNSERFSQTICKMYLRLGLTDVVMYHCREDSQHRMLRRMLIVLSLYPTFILKCQKWCDLNPSIPLDLQNQMPSPPQTNSHLSNSH